MKISEWKVEIERERAVKDRFFRSKYPGSPIPFEDRARFKGLKGIEVRGKRSPSKEAR